MHAKRLLIANRGETALRILRTARRLGWHCCLLTSSDDARGSVARLADEHASLPTAGPQAYLDRDAIVQQAQALRIDAVHPGIGFLSEDARLAGALASLGIGWVGPSATCLERFGDKRSALALATRLQVPCPAGSDALHDADQALQFVAQHPADTAWMLKAVCGGGGRGIRAVPPGAMVADLFAAASREAQRAFGDGRLYLEQRIDHARHIEVQVVADRSGAAQVLGLRECSVQRRHQKLVEWSPPQGLSPAQEAQLRDHALALARAAGLTHLGTMEFLLDRGGRLWFIEANPRLQLEHTVTEQRTGLDLVELQLRITDGASLQDLGLAHPPAERGGALQCRINAEQALGEHWVASTGTVTQLGWPGGPGLRIDTALQVGQNLGAHYDSLVAKLIVSLPQPDLPELLHAARLALQEVQIEGLPTNVALLEAMLGALDPRAIDTQWLDRWLPSWSSQHVEPSALQLPGESHPESQLESPTAGVLTQWCVVPGQPVRAAQLCAIIEAMKMEHEVLASHAGYIAALVVPAGTTVRARQVLAHLQPGVVAPDEASSPGAAPSATEQTNSLLELNQRRALLADAARPEAMAKRHALGKRSAREQLALVLDEASLREYGEFAVAAQRSRRSLDDLIRNTPADGLITGIGQAHADQLGESGSQVAVMAYDYTVLAGTQGMFNHKKSDRLLNLAERHRLPVVVHAEGGGGRPGDVDWLGVAGLDCTTFHHYGALAGKVPRIALVTGRCFAGNAALAGASDVIIATRDTSIGMGGPAMIEGAGLGQVAAEAVGPVSMQAVNGVIDLVCDTDEQACRMTRRVLGMAQGVVDRGAEPDTASLRRVVPEHRLRVYEVRDAIAGLVDVDSFIELRAAYGVGVVTGLARINGTPFGLMANNPKHLGGALDASACDKLFDFLSLCSAWKLPVVSLCDTPGFMVGPEAEAQGMVRKASRLFNVAAQLPRPLLVVVLRKGYGLGAQAMAGGSFAAPASIVAWPSAEFGAMGLEGAVRLGFRKELEAVQGAQREALFGNLLAQAYDKGKALNMASMLEIDSVIDPASTRDWLAAQLLLSER